MNIDKIKQIMNLGFNCINVYENKNTHISYRKYIKEKNEDIKATGLYGLICGYNNLECINFDLHVIKDPLLRDLTFYRLMLYLYENIENFKSKIVVIKTKNDGYHFLYQTYSVSDRTTKIAHYQKEILAEIKGVLTYVCMYDGNYEDIGYINDTDRNTLMRAFKLIDI